MHLLKPASLLPLLLLLLPGCSKPRLVYDVSETFRSTAYATVAPDPRKDRIVIREGLRPLSPDLHLRAVLAELEARRYHSVPAAEADLWVAVYVLSGGSPQAARGGGPKGKGEGHRGGRGGARGGPPPAEEGPARGICLLVQLEDRKTGLPVWQGEANLDVRDRDPGGHPLSIEEAVHELLLPLPRRP